MPTKKEPAPKGPLSAMPTMDRLFVQRKIERALMALELTFAECQGLVVFDEKEETASWRFNKTTGEESIHLGPKVAALDATIIEMILRHEILHRSMFHGFGENHHNHALSNLALDICINRLLYEAYPEQMRKTSLAMYPEESKTTAVALADCTADPTKLPSELSDLWQMAWIKQNNKYTILNPASLYFRLHRLLINGRIPPVVTLYFGAFDEHMPRRPGARLERMSRAAAADISARLPRGSALGEALSEYNVIPVAIGTSDVEQFLQKMRLRRVVDDTAKKVLAPLAKEVRIQPWPAWPTRLGLVYQLTGVSEAMGLYWNREMANQGARLCVALYLDVSGSMIPHFPLVAGFARALAEIPVRLRVFDTAVREVELSSLTEGRISGGGGTDFDAPLKDLIEDGGVECGVLFTDGEAPVSPGMGRRLLTSKKRLFVVYLGNVRSSPLDRYAKSSIVVPTR
ncbi:MAG: hypothetical protein Q8O67_33305 [Deltaproteobacteria bacterium]|nr:hypothetical protein [Deltaproteobacteria bacterium]